MRATITKPRLFCSLLQFQTCFARFTLICVWVRTPHICVYLIYAGDGGIRIVVVRLMAERWRAIERRNRMSALRSIGDCVDCTLKYVYVFPSIPDLTNKSNKFNSGFVGTHVRLDVDVFPIILKYEEINDQIKSRLSRVYNAVSCRVNSRNTVQLVQITM